MTGVVPFGAPSYLGRDVIRRGGCPGDAAVRAAFDDAPDLSVPDRDLLSANRGILMDRIFLLIGALSGFLSVAIGAFGAHGLQGRLDERALEIVEIGVRYQMSHALALLVIALLMMKGPSGWLAGAGWAMAVGILLFSGSLYALALSGIRGFGAVAPLGGTALLIGWVLLAIGGWKLLAGGSG